jgi:hypothetical protein
MTSIPTFLFSILSPAALGSGSMLTLIHMQPRAHPNAHSTLPTLLTGDQRPDELPENALDLTTERHRTPDRCGSFAGRE